MSIVRDGASDTGPRATIPDAAMVDDIRYPGVSAVKTHVAKLLIFAFFDCVGATVSADLLP
ncbi:hypothetical protein [Streptomyces sp. CT34]|uniref:hypothetical protein n=1 Tax=Streptomyces sp. CT34 TaxID=1553907 RepID=UPI0012FF2D62|nr:hypothetical protein [Streptomyces sp. CT34]